jgi:hypothetical protein
MLNNFVLITEGWKVLTKSSSNLLCNCAGKVVVVVVVVGGETEIKGT